MTPARTELAYDILMKLLDKNVTSAHLLVKDCFYIADTFLEEVKRHEAENEVMFGECVHMQMTMFNEKGTAECFSCGKKVNMDREVVESFHDHK